ncbi:MAG: hypothetical protein K0U23_04445 [Gammaproteobacteria bacterium]|nr:hypothetical protein [Gammaproteobacteria bacterium]
MTLFLAHTTIFILIAYAFKKLFKLNLKTFIALLCGFIAISFVPIRGVSIADYIRGYFSDLSITSAIYAWVLLFCSFRKSVDLPRRQLNGLWVWLLLCAILVYPSMLTTMGNWMPYYWGYAPFWLSLVFLMMAVMVYFCRFELLAFSILITVCAFYLHVLPSHNLWNYAIDPIIVIIAICQCILSLRAKMSKVLN